MSWAGWNRPRPEARAAWTLYAKRLFLLLKRLRLATCVGQEDGQQESGGAGVQCAACECDLETAAGH